MSTGGLLILDERVRPDGVEEYLVKRFQDAGTDVAGRWMTQSEIEKPDKINEHLKKKREREGQEGQEGQESEAERKPKKQKEGPKVDEAASSDTQVVQRKRNTTKQRATAQDDERRDAQTKDTMGKKKKKKRRATSCGSCAGCTRAGGDCGECSACLDKPKFGGPGTQRQRCKLRSCLRLKSRRERLKRSAMTGASTSTSARASAPAAAPAPSKKKKLLKKKSGERGGSAIGELDGASGGASGGAGGDTGGGTGGGADGGVDRGAAARPTLQGEWTGEDCGMCDACRDKKKFGGPDIKRQACRLRPKSLKVSRKGGGSGGNGGRMSMQGAELDAALWPEAAAAGWSVVERQRGSWLRGQWDVTAPTGQMFRSLSAAIRARRAVEKAMAEAWVCCDKCSKWRKLPEGVEAPPDDAPWSCAENPDTEYNRCEVAEESWKQEDWENEKWEEEDDEEEEGDEEEAWVCCDVCAKWRKLPAGHSAPPEMAPWSCADNPDTTHNRCELAEETWDQEEWEEENESVLADGHAKSENDDFDDEEDDDGDEEDSDEDDFEDEDLSDDDDDVGDDDNQDSGDHAGNEEKECAGGNAEMMFLDAVVVT